MDEDEKLADVIDAAETEGGEDGAQEDAEDNTPIVVHIGDEPAAEDGDDDPEIELPDDAKHWAKKLRETAEERRKENRELKKRLQELEAKAAPVVVEDVALPPKPSILDDDIDGDEDVFGARLEKWLSQKAEHEAKKAAKAKDAEQAAEKWQAKVAKFEKRKAELRVDDYEGAEEVVQSVFSQEQQAILVHGAKDPAVLAYAIGKDPKRAAELAAMTDNVEFIWALSKIEDQVKVSPRKPTVKPEKTVTSSGGVSGSADAHLSRLRDEAAKTGDFTKVAAYKRQLRGN